MDEANTQVGAAETNLVQEAQGSSQSPINDVSATPTPDTLNSGLLDYENANKTTTQVEATASWRDYLSEEFKNDPNATKFKTADEFMKSYKGLQNTVLNRLKEEDVTVEELAQYLSPEQLTSLKAHQDVPDSPDSYEIGDSSFDFTAHPVANEGLGKAKQLAHKYGVSKEVFKEFMQLEMEVAQRSTQHLIQNNIAAIKQEYGTEWVAKANDVSNAVMKLGGKESYDYFNNNKMLTNPHLFKLISKVAERMKEDPMPSGISAFGSSGGSTASVDDRLKSFFKSDRYGAYLKGDPAARAELAELYKASNPMYK